MKAVLAQEDTDGNFQIHSTDKGPKVFSLGTASSNGHNSFDVSRHRCLLLPGPGPAWR